MTTIPPNKILFKPTIAMSGYVGKNNLKIVDTIGNKIRAYIPVLTNTARTASKSIDPLAKKIATTGGAVGLGGWLASLGLESVAKPFRPFEQGLGLPKGSALVAILAVIAIIIILVIAKR